MTAELVPVDTSSIEALDPAAREAAVTQYLTNARDWLTTCVELTGPKQIAAVKAEIATTAEATRQLHLSKEIQLDAKEMLRRAEYTLDKAIRKGQAEGTVATTASAARDRQQKARSEEATPCPTAKELEPSYYDRSNIGESIAGMSDGVTDARFDEVVTEAKAERNLSRANVVRKLKGKDGRATRQSVDARLGQIEELAGKGYSSDQIGREIGTGGGYVRRLANQAGITITADKVVGRARRVDSNRVVGEAVNTLAGLASTVKLINYADLDQTQIGHWSDSLKDSLRALNGMRTQLNKAKEADQ